MKKYISAGILLLLCPFFAGAQTVQDFFNSKSTPVTYLGIDFSHVKLIGNFSEFMEAGNRNVMEIRDVYFPGWNRIIVDQRDKFDIAGMLQKEDIYYDTDMITSVNSRTDLDSLVSLNAVKYKLADIEAFVSSYDLQGKSGIGVLFIAESLNKSSVEAVFHFVAFDMATKEILFTRRLKGTPNGFGLKNYWVNSVYRIINDVKYYYFNEWKLKAVPEGQMV